MKWVLLILVVTLCLWPLALNASHKIRVLKSDWCPYVCTGTDSDSSPGYVTEIIQRILTKHGYYIDYVEMNFARGVYLLEKGRLDLILTIFKAEAGSLKLNQVPVAHSQNYFYTAINSAWKYENINSLKPIKFGIVNGYDYLNPDLNDYIYENLDANITIVSGNHAQKRLLRLLGRDRIDTFIDDLLVVNYLLTQMSPTPDIRIAGQIQSPEPIFVGVSQKFPHYRELLKTLDKELTNLINSPIHDKIHDKYQHLVGTPKLSPPPRLTALNLSFNPGLTPPLTVQPLKTTTPSQE